VFSGKVASPWCTMLSGIDVDDNEIFSKDDQRQLFMPYVGRCVDEEFLKTVINDIVAFYMQRGYITNRPYLKKTNHR